MKFHSQINAASSLKTDSLRTYILQIRDSLWSLLDDPKPHMLLCLTPYSFDQSQSGQNVFTWPSLDGVVPKLVLQP